MALPPIIIPEPQFCDANGLPYAGGTIATYIPGTTTPKQTWMDPAQAALNTNPILLDSAGRCLWYGDGEYRLVLHDAFGNLIWDQLSTTIVSAAMAPVVEAATIADAVELLGINDLIAVETNRAEAEEEALWVNDGRFLLLDGGTMINDGTNDGSLFLEHDPVSAMEAVNKRYVDAETTRAEAAEAVLQAEIDALAPSGTPIVQGGSATLGASGYVHVTFPVAFAAACDAVTATISDISYPASGVGPMTFLITNLTTTGADVAAYNAAGGLTVPLTFWWIALGH